MRLAMILLVVPSLALAADVLQLPAQKSDCLTQAQREDLDSRALRATMTTIFDIVPFQLETSRARSDYATAQSALKACTGFDCGSQQVAAQEALARLESAKARSDAMRASVQVKLNSEMDKVRAAYPPCNEGSTQ